MSGKNRYLFWGSSTILQNRFEFNDSGESLDGERLWRVVLRNRFT